MYQPHPNNHTNPKRIPGHSDPRRGSYSSLFLAQYLAANFRRSALVLALALSGSAFAEPPTADESQQLRDRLQELHTSDLPSQRDAWTAQVAQTWADHLFDGDSVATADPEALRDLLLIAEWSPWEVNLTGEADFDAIANRLIAEPEILKPLNQTEWGQLDQLAKRWGASDETRAAIALAWLDQSDNWKESSSWQFGTLMRLLPNPSPNPTPQADGDAVTPSRPAILDDIIETAREKYLENAEFYTEHPKEHLLLSLSRAVAEADSDRRSGMARATVERYARQPDAYQGVEIGYLGDIGLRLRAGGVASSVLSTMLGSWLEANDWQSQTVQQLSDLAWALRASTEAEDQQRLISVVEHAWRQYLSAPQQLSDDEILLVLRLSDWPTDLMRRPEGVTYRAIHRRLIGNDGMLARFGNLDHFGALLETAKRLGASGNQQAELVSHWMNASDTWTQADVQSVNWLIAPLLKGNTAESKAALEKCLTLGRSIIALDEGYFDADHPAPMVNRMYLIRNIALSGPTEAERDQMLSRLRTNLIQPDPADLSLSNGDWQEVYWTLAYLSWNNFDDIYRYSDPADMPAELRTAYEQANEGGRAFMAREHLTDRDLRVQGLAEHLAKNLANGLALNEREYNLVGFLSRSIDTDAQRQLIEMQLLNEDGSANPLAAQLLAWSHRTADDSGTWRQELDGRLLNTQLRGDARASWLLARSYTEEIIDRHRELWAGRKWINEALVAADSEEARLGVVRYMLDRYLLGSDFEEAETFLDGMSFQFEDERIEAIFDAWTKQVSANAVAVEAERRSKAGARAEAHISVLEQRLRVAIEKNNKESIRRYERLLAAQQ